MPKLCLQFGYVFVVCLFGVQSLHAASYSECIRPLYKIARKAKTLPITRSKAVFPFGENIGLTEMKVEATRAFHSYLDARLAEYPQLIRNQIREDLQTRVLHKDKKESNGAFSPGEDRGKWIVIELPLYLYATPLYFHILAHELEHYLQRTAVEHLELDKNELGRFRNWNFDFLHELGAMRAEWNYAQYLPPQVIKSFAKFLESSPNMLTNLKQERWLFGAQNMTQKEYLKNEWRHGRYNKTRIILRHIFTGMPIIP